MGGGHGGPAVEGRLQQVDLGLGQVTLVHCPTLRHHHHHTVVHGVDRADAEVGSAVHRGQFIVLTAVQIEAAIAEDQRTTRLLNWPDAGDGRQSN